MTCRCRCPQEPASSAAYVGLRGTLAQGAAWLASALVLGLTPKCPLCLAGWVAAASGVTLSAATAGQVRSLALVASSSLLVALIAQLFVRRMCRRAAAVPVSVPQELGRGGATYEKIEVIGTPS